MVRPSKSNSRHLIRRACFNLPKLVSVTTTQSTTSLINTHQPGSPTTHSAISMPVSHHPTIDHTLSVPLPHRKTHLLDEPNNSQRHLPLTLSTSQSKEAPSRGISPRFNRHSPSPTTTTTTTSTTSTTTTSTALNPSSIEKR